MKYIIFLLFTIPLFANYSTLDPFQGFRFFKYSGSNNMHKVDVGFVLEKVATDNHGSNHYLNCGGSNQPPTVNFYYYNSDNKQVIFNYNKYDHTKSNGQKVCLYHSIGIKVLGINETYKCPDGSKLDDETLVCVAVPECTEQQYLGDDNQCHTITDPSQLNPDGDYDGDGIPNSSDGDYDGDGIPNSYDNYIGNGQYSPDNGGGQSSSETMSCYDLESDWQLKLNCFGDNKLFNFSCQTTSNGVPYVTKKECLELKDPCIDIKSNFAKNCKAPLQINGDCKSKNYKVILNTLTCDNPEPINSPCDVAYDNIKKDCKSPSYMIGKCTDSYNSIIQNTLECVTPDDDSSSSSDDASDSNSSSSNSSSSTSDSSINSLNENLNTNIDKMINHIRKVEDNTLNSSNALKSIDSKLSTLIANSNDNSYSSSINQKLGIANNQLSDITRNTSNIVSKIDTTNSKLDTVNNNLNDIKNQINGDGVEGNFKQDLGIDSSKLDETSSYIDNLEDNLAYLTEDVTSIKGQFENLRDMLKGDKTSLTIQSGSCSDVNLQKFGSYIAPYAPITALITYLSMMMAIFKMIFAYLARGEN